MNRKTVISATNSTMRKLKALAGKKAGVKTKMVVTAKNLGPKARKIAVMVNKGSNIYKNKKTVTSAATNTILKLKVLAKKKEGVRGKLAVFAKKLATTAKEKEGVREKLVITAKKLSETAKEKESVRQKLAVTAKKLAAIAKEKEVVRRKLAVTANQLKESSELLKQQKIKDEILLASIGDAVIAIDRNWNIILWNRGASQLSGWTEDEVLGKPLRNFIKLIREMDRGENIKFIEDAMITGQTHFLEGSTILIGKGGKEVPVGDSAAPILNDKKEVTGAIIIMRDVSREKEASMLHSDFAYASHQLRTPVNRALWSIETVLKEEDIKKIKEGAQLAYNALKSVGKLSEELIEVSEIDQGTISPQIEEVKLTNLFDEVIDDVGKKAEGHGIKVVIPSISISASITSCQKLLKRIFVEILDNAIIYSPKDSEIKIDITNKEDAVLFEIKDSGLGIASEHQPLIFTKFFRGGNYSATEIAGAGLGLYIAKAYVKLLRGKIWFKSEEKKGTTFYISIPTTAQISS